MIQDNKQSIGEIVRKCEDEYINGTVQKSKYVEQSMYETVETIDAYLNSQHISGRTDSQGRDKPFFNIVTSAANIWYRATDIDRNKIIVTPSKTTDVVDIFLANIFLQDWMKHEKFGQFLNSWGRTLSRYGSSVIEIIENDDGLNISIIPWNILIVDPIDFYQNPVIKVLELTEAQLRQNKNYDQAQVQAMIDAVITRETLNKNRKDNKSSYYRLYELHGNLPLSHITNKKSDSDTYVQQMQVISFVGGRKRNEYDDFVLYKGRERQNPYMITHLIEEDGQTLAIGAVQHLFESQWIQNHSAKAIKDQLDLASKLIFQTADPNFAGQNALTAIENGDILIHGVNTPVTQINNGSHDIVSWQNYAVSWKQLGNEIVGISEAMLGAMPKSGTAWRQTEALLQESYNLFELMTENKGLYIEQILREYVIPYLKRKKMNNADEIATTLDQHDVQRIEQMYIKNTAIKKTNNDIIDMVLNNEEPTPEMQAELLAQNTMGVQEGLNSLGNQRFFKPDEINWKKQLEDLEWEIDIDVTGEAKDMKSALATLNTALQVIMNPAYQQNPQAKMVVGKILNLTGTLSPLELQQSQQAQPTQAVQLPEITNNPNERHI